MNEASSRRWLTLLIPPLACFLWSTAFLAIKLGTKASAGIDIYSFAGARFFLSGLILAPFFLCKSGIWGALIRHWKLVLLVGFLQTFLVYTLFYTALTLVPGGFSSILVGSQPLLAAVMAHFVMENDRMTMRRILILFIGFSGIVLSLISRQPWKMSSLSQLGGAAILLTSSLLSVSLNILIAKNRGKVEALALNTAQLLFGGTLLLILGASCYGMPDFLNEPPAFYGTLTWLIVVSAGAFSMWFYILSQPGVKVSELNSWKFLIPVSGATLCWLFIPEEPVDSWQLIGMCLVALSIYLYNRPQKVST